MFLQSATGLTLSVTVTVKLQLALNPALSVTVHTTVVIPIGNLAPARVGCLLKSFVTVVVQLSQTAAGQIQYLLQYIQAR